MGSMRRSQPGMARRLLRCCSSSFSLGPLHILICARTGGEGESWVTHAALVGARGVVRAGIARGHSVSVHRSLNFLIMEIRHTLVWSSATLCSLALSHSSAVDASRGGGYLRLKAGCAERARVAGRRAKHGPANRHGRECESPNNPKTPRTRRLQVDRAPLNVGQKGRSGDQWEKRSPLSR